MTESRVGQRGRGHEKRVHRTVGMLKGRRPDITSLQARVNSNTALSDRSATVVEGGIASWVSLDHK